MPTIESPTAPAISEAVPASLHDYPRRSARQAPPRRRARILSVSTDVEDHDLLRKMLDETVWQIVTAATCREAFGRLNRLRMSVILCEHKLEDGTWTDVLNHVAKISKPAPIVVTARLADEHLWAEVLNLGGYDVLAKPFREREVLHTITSAMLYGAPSVPRVRAAGGG